MSDPRIRGLYAITPDEPDTGRLVAMVDAAIDGGARIVQYRAKDATDDERRAQAVALAASCMRRHALFIVNDDAELAVTIDGAGLHVGASDADDLDALRARLGPGRMLGVSCYDDLARAREAAAAKADYIAFGSVFPSGTKPAAVRAPLALFDAARPLGVASVAIGGITLDNLPSLVAAGADAAAVINELFASRDPSRIRATASALSSCFAPTTLPSAP